MLKFQVNLFIFISFFLLSNGANNYLKTRPPWLNRCKFSDEDFVKCLTSSAQKFFNELSKGIPELKNIPPVDPFQVNKVRIDQTSNNAVSLKAELSNLVLKGLSRTQVKECKVSNKDFSWYTHYLLPKVYINADYEMNGRILIVSLRGKGKLSLELDNFEVIMRTKTKLYGRDDFTFYNITSNKIEISTKGMKVKLDNLFNGNQELERSTNQFFNENWSDVFEAMKPIILSVVEEIMLDLLRKAFVHIPANHWIEDIPKAT